MKSSIIEALYYGEVNPFECDRTPNAQRDAVNRTIEQEKEYLQGRLSPEDAQRLEELDRLFVQAGVLENIDSFGYGLQFGIRLMQEIGQAAL